MANPVLTGEIQDREGVLQRLIEIEEDLKQFMIETKSMVAPDEFEQLKCYWAALILVS